MNLDYTKVTHEELLEQFRNRLLSDPKFKDISASSIYQIYMEMMAGTFDMLHFYLGRTAEEMFLDSAKLDSSIIKLSKNLGYNPRRAIPAKCEIAITLKGPLPKNLEEGDTIWFNNEKMDLSYNNHKFKLDRCYSYTFTDADIINGIGNSSWQKTIIYSVDAADANGYYDLSSTDNLGRIKAYQCEIKETTVYAISHASNLGQSYQFYDIDDVKFSDFYGIRDPFACNKKDYNPLGGWCKIGIGKNKTEAFSKDKICDIELENVYCNAKVRALNNDLSLPKKLNVCRVESNQDKTVRITFGDGTLVNCGFMNEDEILFVQYVTTDGASGNTPNVIGSAMKNGSKLFAHGGSRIIDVTSNVIIALNSDISGGSDFESQISMKNNAAVYFAARGQLINKKDFTSYFKTISDPIVAKNAIAWNISEVQSSLSYDGIDGNDKQKIIASLDNAKNAVYYSIVGDLYESLSQGQYSPKMLYLDEDAQIGLTTLYNNHNTFLSHIGDLAKSLQWESTDNITDLFISQSKNRDDPFSLNTSDIFDSIEDRLPFGVYPISIPPIVQYFDLVGTVDVSRLANIADYQHDVEAKIYKWLSDNQGFNNKIFKSDLIKLFYDNAFTAAVNLDLTPSALVYNQGKTLEFTGLQDHQGSGDSDAAKPYVLKTDSGRNGYTDVIIPNQADNGQSITLEYLESKPNIKFDIYEITGNTAVFKSTSGKTTISKIEQLEDGRLHLQLTGFIKNISGSFPSNASLRLTFDLEECFYSKPSESNTIVNSIINMNGYSERSGSTETPVALDYDAKIDPADTTTAEDKNTVRQINLKRNRFITNKITDLSEKSFNIYYAAKDFNQNAYEAAYKVVKFAIEDGMLDDNNNIVNFSLPNEIAVVRLKINYRHGR